MNGPAAPHASDPEAPVPVVVGPGCCFEGLLAFRGGALVAGRLQGAVFAHGTLWIGEGALVRARIEVDSLVVAGTLEAQIHARERVELLPTARVRGRIRSPRLAVAEQARFEGQLVMAADGQAAPAGRQEERAAVAP